MAVMQNFRDMTNKWYVKYVAAPIVAFSMMNALESGLENKVNNTPTAKYISGSVYAGEMSASEINNEGIKLYINNQKDKAANKFQEAIKVDPKYADAYIMMGRTQYDLGNSKMALEYISKAMEMEISDSQKIVLYKELSKIYKQLGNKELASEYINKYETGIIQSGKMNEKIKNLIQNIREGL